MKDFGTFYLDKEKDIVVELQMEEESREVFYTLRTPNHGSGNLICNLSVLCRLPLSQDERGLLVIKGRLPCYIDSQNRELYVFRLLDTKVANIDRDGRVERKASIPAIAKTLMSQTKDYRLDFRKTLVKTYIFRECKFRTDLHTHMNANLDPDVLIALGIHHQIRYPLYYVRKLNLRCSPAQEATLAVERAQVEKRFSDSPLTGKYLARKINDQTFINFADLILHNLENAPYNLPRIRASLTILKDGQAVFTNLEKVYLYRYVFCKGQRSDTPVSYTESEIQGIPDRDIVLYLTQMQKDRQAGPFRNNTLFQDKLLWIARMYEKRGIRYAEISDTTLVKPDAAPGMLSLVHEVMPAIYEETGVTIRFLAAIRRTPLTIVKDQIADDAVRENLQTIRAIAMDPYVAGSDIIGEEINDIREMAPLLTELVHLTEQYPGFVIRIHAGENDGLRDNVYNSLKCVQSALREGQGMPRLRIGHGLYTANLKSARGQQLMRDLASSGAVLEFQITSNVRLNNLSQLNSHPLKTYLHAGVACVQGTDGGALYGTDSIDEELSLEKMLNLSREDLLAMKRTDEDQLQKGLKDFACKMEAFEGLSTGDVSEFYRARIAAQQAEPGQLLMREDRLSSMEIFSERIRELPIDRVPVIIVGGSFHQEGHVQRMRQDVCAFLDRVIKELDPGKTFLVLGPSLRGYEKYVYDLAHERFDVYAFVPSRISRQDAARLKKTRISLRVSIEPVRMAIYKSYAYEIFKRRPSVLIALDGNTAAGNMIQEAKNGKRKSDIFVSSHVRALWDKARTLEGYARSICDPDAAEQVVAAVERAYPEKWLRVAE
ncbi:MAG: adenosine deaminase [Clostridia bacterium]|nr:adenosine deaminase [Clostridia bacterium]